MCLVVKDEEATAPAQQHYGAQWCPFFDRPGTPCYFIKCTHVYFLMKTKHNCKTFKLFIFSN